MENLIGPLRSIVMYIRINYLFTLKFINMKFLKNLILFTCLSIFSCTAFSQSVADSEAPTTETSVQIDVPNGDVFDGEKPDLDLILNWYNGLIALLTMLWGFIAKAFKIDKKVNNFVFVVLAGGIAIIAIFVYWGLAGGITAALSVLTAMGIFDLFKGGVKLTAKKES